MLRPKVSILLISFNSEKTISETLLSLVKQDCSVIEVVIGDDFSSDSTRELINNWVCQYSYLFYDVKTVFNSSNIGICSNLKNIYDIATGEWLKPIAADDILEPNSLSELLKFARADDDVLIGRVKINGSHDGDYLPRASVKAFINGALNQNIKIIAKSNVIPAPGVLIRSSSYRSVGGIDLDFKHLDDWPLWINMLIHGRKFRCIDVNIISYRIYEESISGTKLPLKMNKDYLNDLCLFYEKYQAELLTGADKLDQWLICLRFNFARRTFLGSVFIYRLISFLIIFSPHFWLRILSVRQSNG